MESRFVFNSCIKKLDVAFDIYLSVTLIFFFHYLVHTPKKIVSAFFFILSDTNYYFPFYSEAMHSGTHFTIQDNRTKLLTNIFLNAAKITRQTHRNYRKKYNITTF